MTGDPTTIRPLRFFDATDLLRPPTLGAVRVLLVLDAFADETGELRAKQGWMASEAKLAYLTAQRAVNELTHLGLIEVDKRMTPWRWRPGPDAAYSRQGVAA